MLERTTKSYFEDILSSDFSFLKSQNISLENKRSLRLKLQNSNFPSKADDVCGSSDDHIMTRKTRTRRPRIPAIQSGYCAVCTVPYNSVEEHIQSKKHQKLIGEDANYIALNGSLNGFLQTSTIPYLNLNGIDAIGVHETSLEEYSLKYRRKNMPRTRAASVVCDRIVKPSSLSPTGSDITGHHLRSRRNINYMTPPLDDDSLQECPDISIPEKPEVEPLHHEYKEYRELRSSTRALAKLTVQVSENHDEVWNSGRPKRACIRQKRISADDRLVSDNKTYYKVEVMTSKLRSSSHNLRDDTRRQNSQSPRGEEDEKDKGLIVKFKKLRNSELVQLNNEATNFLFPRKDDDTSEDDDIDGDVNSAVGSIDKDGSTVLLSSDTDECSKAPQGFKHEDEGSMDSTYSENKKKKRRTHAEAFIMDNQKYYKFETPGSRLRYHGTYLPSVPKSPKYNDAVTPKVETSVKAEEPEEKLSSVSKKPRVTLENYKFSFEKIPENAPWYSTFVRQDKGEQRYNFVSDYFWDPFILPYQIPSITPLDPKICMGHYNQLLKCLCEHMCESDLTDCSTPDPSISNSTLSLYDPDIDEDSKMSATTLSSTCSLEEFKPLERKRRGRRPGVILQQQGTSGKNPRKSPRQHASTLAILSSLLQQRKRRSRNRAINESNQSLVTIPEEENLLPHLTEMKLQQELKQETNRRIGHEDSQQVNQAQEQASQLVQQTKIKPKTHWRCKPKIDYFSIAQKIDDELDTVLDDNFEDYELEITDDNLVDFHLSKVNVSDILRLFEDDKLKETEKSCRRFFNGTPGRKPGKRKKQNKTGWPNKNRRLAKRGQDREKDEDNDDSTIDSVSVNMDSDEEICDDYTNSTDSSKKVDTKHSANKSEALKDVKYEENCDVDRVDKDESEVIEKILVNKVISTNLQPYVCVQKLDSNKLINKDTGPPKRMNVRQRRMPGSPKSPKMLRKPRGRWYRER